MTDQLEELVKEQEQLRAMKQSCAEFEKNLSEKVFKYLTDTFHIKKDDNFSIIELIAKAKRHG